MANTLTQQDIAQLQQYATAGDRYKYWSYLSAKGDPYATLALGVVTGATSDGYIANHFAATFAPAGSPLANPDSTQAWWNLGADLMKADLAARINNGNAVDLSFQIIQGYHATVYQNYNLPPQAFTPYIPFKTYIQTGDWATANQLWHQMLTGSESTSITTSLKALILHDGNASLLDRASWLATTSQDFTDYYIDSGTIGSDRNSLRNANFTNGWSYDPSSGQWTKSILIPMDPFGRSTVINADPATTQFLNQERQFRLQHFGNNVLNISSLADPNTINTGDLSGLANTLLQQAGAYQLLAGGDPVVIGEVFQYNSQLQTQLGGLLQGHDLSNAIEYQDSNGIWHYSFDDGYEVRLDPHSGQFATTTNQMLADGTQQWTQTNFDNSHTTVSISPPANDGSITTEYDSFDSNGQLTQETVRITDSNGNPIEITQTDASGNTQELYNSGTNGAQSLTQSLTSVADALTLLKAIQTGQPLPITVSGLRLASDIVPGNTSLAGAANVGSGILSLMSLDNAFQRGDTVAAITAGAQAINFGATAYANYLGYSGNNALSQALADGGFGEAGSAIQGINQALPYLNLVNSIVHGDAVGTAVAAISMIPGMQWVGAVYAVYSIIASLFGDDNKQPDPWGSGRYVWNGYDTAVSAAGQTGGDQAVSGFMNNVLATMNTLVAREQQQNPGSALGLIPNRMPSLGYGMDGFSFTDIDPLTGVQKNPSLRYDTNGAPYNAVPGSPESYMSLGEAFITSALARGAIAPQWEVQTAAIQTQAGDPQAGLTEEERAGRAGDLAPPQTGTTQTWRPVVLDLNGSGIQTVSEAQSGVAFNVDDSGYLKNTDWISNNDAFLVLDRNDNGQIDSSRELFSNGMVGLDRRGLAGLAWMDSNYDGILNASDPVFNQLRVWQDKNGNGIVDAGEETTLAQDGITSLNYSMGQFSENGQVRQMASPDLTADTLGEKVSIVPQGILLQNSNGQSSLLVTRVDDLTQVQANEDGLTGIENTELIVNSADLLTNDTFGGFLGRDLTFNSALNFRHGSGYVDANKFVHFTPDTNYYGTDAGFDYVTTAPNGQAGTGTVAINIQHVNQPPSPGPVDLNSRAVYGYTPVQYDDSGNYMSGGNPIYQPYAIQQYYDWDTGTTTSTYVYDLSQVQQYSGFGVSMEYHTTPVTYEDSGAGQVHGSDVDDPASSLTYQVVNQPQYGSVAVNPDGTFQYTGWKEPGVPSDDIVVDGQYGGTKDGTLYTQSNLPGQAVYPTSDVFQVKITDPHGASTIESVSVPHYGPYLPPTPPAGGGGKKPIALDLDQNGFSFIKLDDSNVFFDVNGDGWKHRTSWVAPGDGLLVYDANGNGKADGASEIAFTRYMSGAQSDLEGLTAFDSNHDGIFSKLDDKWSQFGVWQDVNQNGVTDPGEFKTLDQMGIASISLTSDHKFSVVDGNTIQGIAKVTMNDGTTRDAADVTLAYSKDVQVTNADGTTSIVTPPPFSPSGQEIDGTEGNDLILGKTGNTVIKTGAGNDVVFAGDGNDLIEPGSGNDVIYAGGGDDIVMPGAGNDVVYAGLGNDFIIGGDGNNALFGEGGNDVIFSGKGNDLIDGGAGNDVLSGGAGDDTIFGGTGNDALFGGDGNDVLSGGDGNDRLDGGAGNDVLDGGAGADLMVGGTGNDTYVVDNVGDVVIENPNEGIDTVRASISYTLTDNVENLTLTGSDNLTGTGNSLDNVIIGNSGNDTLIGGGGNDRLVAGTGIDTLIGGTGDDTYVVNNASDVVVENSNEGMDTVLSSVTYALTDSVENLVLTGTADLNGSGNVLDNVLTGNSGNNILDGGVGADTMIGGGGNDTYIVDNVNDKVIENANEGTDLVLSSVSYTLSDNVENLTLTGNDSLTGTGNGLDNVITGNAGNDTLIGGDGNDRLVAGSGATTMLGGTGDDTYVVNSVSDSVVENLGEGNDTVFASINYALTDNVENLTLTGSADLTGTGNGLDNVITGNSGNNVLDGGAGADTMIGGQGNDTYVVDNTGDVVIEGLDGGTDTVLASISYVLPDNVENLTLTDTANLNGTGNGLDNVMTGNSGNNILDGGIGADIMIGGQGNDTYVVDNVGDVVIENVNEGIDTVLASVTYALSDNVENLTLTGTADINGIGNALDNVLTGNSGNNVLDGGIGADTMLGGAGNDTYVVDNVGDVVIEDPNAGIDTVLASISYALTDNVENLTLTGGADLTGTGNGLDNVITGNSGNNVLDGGAGADTMIGGLGNDTYVVDSTGDVVVEKANEGIDSVFSSISYVLPDNVENLTLTGSADLTGTGNGLDNVITGNSGNNVLDGGAGADTMIGGQGNDTYVVDNTGDVVIENPNAGIDTVLASVSYALSDNVENLTLTGSDNLTGTGNNLDNVIIGNTGNDTLIGGAGNDTLIAGSGVDTMIGGLGNDTFVVNNAADLVVENPNEGIDTVLSSVTYALTANVENLTLTGIGDTNGTGNSLDNIIIGNSGNNVLTGGGGNDTFIGGQGNDTLIGGTGNDTYVYNQGDGLDSVTDIGGTNAVRFGSGLSLQNVVVRLTTASGTPYTVYSSADDQRNNFMGEGRDEEISGGHNKQNTTLIAHMRVLDAYGNEQPDQGMDFEVTVDRRGNITSPLQSFQFADGGVNTFDDMLVKTDTVWARNISGPVITGRNDDIIYAGPRNTGVWAGSGNDIVYADRSGTKAYGEGGDDLLVGSRGNDTLDGGWGVDVVYGAEGNDVLSDPGGNSALLGGEGDDTITGGAGNDFIVGGTGNDTIVTGATRNVVAFDKGDGRDTILATPGATNTLSLGGVSYRDLSFSEDGEDLVLSVGKRDSITFKGWYASAANQDFTTLQLVNPHGWDEDSRTSDSLDSQKVEEFDFGTLVTKFDQAHAADPSLYNWGPGSSPSTGTESHDIDQTKPAESSRSSGSYDPAILGKLAVWSGPSDTAGHAPSGWSLMNGLLDAHLNGSDSSAIGGDLAYEYGHEGSLSDAGLLATQAVLKDPSFGTAQTLKPFQGLRDDVAISR
ncbi:MAG: beta strand repeat-containing protein [Burkholderiales bacterium]